MAIYHMNVAIASRKSGASSVAGAAYISRSRLADERTGRTYDYRRVHPHERLVADLGVGLPDGAPERWRGRGALWNEVEGVERGAGAQLCRRVVVALPRELDDAQRLELARRIQDYFVAQGMVVDACVHEGVDGANPHLHLMMPLRACDAGGFRPKSKNQYLVRDTEGNEAWMDAPTLRAANEEGTSRWEKVYRWHGCGEPLTPGEASAHGLAKKRSKTPVQRTEYLVDWNERGKVERWRRDVAQMENEALAAAGRHERVDHRSYARQRSERLPTEHEGPAVTWAERRGATRDRSRGRRPRARTARRARNLGVRRRNRRYARLLRGLLSLLARYEAERGRALQEDLGLSRRSRGYGRGLYGGPVRRTPTGRGRGEPGVW